MTAPDEPRPVKAPQSRDGKGISAVYVEPGRDWGSEAERVYVKRQNAYFCRPVWRLFRKTPTLRRELRGLTACRRLGVAVPDVVTYREAGSTAELVLAEVLGAEPLNQALLRPGADRDAIVASVADAIGRLHRAGWTHGALYADHILVMNEPPHRVVLIDLEKARHSRLRRRTDLDRFRRHNAAHLSPAEADAFERRYHTALSA